MTHAQVLYQPKLAKSNRNEGSPSSCLAVMRPSATSRKPKIECRSCRIRRLKYGGTPAFCKNCSLLNTNGDCVIPTSKSVSTDISKALVRTCSTVPEMTALEARSFDYFVHKAAPVLGGGLDGTFWKTIIPRMSLESPAVRYAVLAISQLFEQNTKIPDLTSEWYARSLAGFTSKAASPRDQNDTTKVLLSCVLFTSIEFQQYNALNACKLLKHGYLMIKDVDIQSMDETSQIVVQMLQRQRTLMMMYGHYPGGKTFNTSGLGCLDTQHELLVARQDLFDCIFDSMRLFLNYWRGLLNNQSDVTKNLLLERPQVLDQLKSWHAAFITRYDSYYFQEKIAAMILLIYYETALVWVTTCSRSEFATDQCRHYFEKILSLAAQIHELRRSYRLQATNFSFELGTILPLFWAGWKCRDPSLRAEALRLLYQGSRQEALFRGHIEALTLEKIIEIEREASKEMESRVCYINIEHETDDGLKVRPSIKYGIESKDGHILKDQKAWLW